MDEEKSTTAEDNQVTDPNATDQQTDDQKVDNLDDTSKSTEQSGDDDKKSETKGKDDTPAPKQFDTDLDEWAEKTGRKKPETDQEREDYQTIRDSQREYSRTKQAKDSQKEVNKAIQDAKPAENKQDEDEDEDPGERAERMITEERNLRLRSEYFSEKSVTTEESKVMGEILKEKLDKASESQKQSVYDYWTDPANLEDWHTLAQAKLNANRDTTVIEEEAARKERERIAKESQANGGSRNAKVTTPAKPQGYNRTEYLKSND